MQKFLSISKKVAKFLFIIILKLFEGPKQDPTIAAATRRKRNSGRLTNLFKSIYIGAKDKIKLGAKNYKQAKTKEDKSKRTPKTWARVKQDFKEWYITLVEEYDAKHNKKYPVDTNELPVDVKKEEIKTK